MIELIQIPWSPFCIVQRRILEFAGHVSDHGVWFDDFNLDKRRGNMRSVDVFIGKPNKDVGIVLDQEQQVTLELLVVECVPRADN